MCSVYCVRLVICSAETHQTYERISFLLQAEKKKKLCEEQLPLWLSSLEKQLTSSGLFIGPKVSCNL